MRNCLKPNFGRKKKEGTEINGFVMFIITFEKISKEGDEIRKSRENPKYRLLKRYVLPNYL